MHDTKLQTMEGRVITAITSLEASLLHSSKAFTFFCSVQIYRFRQAVMKDKRESDTLRKALAFYPNFPFKVCIHFTCCFLLFWCLARGAFWKIVLRTSAYSSRRSCCHWKRKPKFPGSTFSLWKKKVFTPVLYSHCSINWLFVQNIEDHLVLKTCFELKSNSWHSYLKKTNKQL